MKIQFPKQSNAQVITALQKVLTGRSLGDLVSLEDQDNNLVMKISKLGTSSLIFSRSEVGANVLYTLTEEKIAFAHRAFKDDVKAKLENVVTKAGGSVLS